jgi:DNA repair photolyase
MSYCSPTYSGFYTAGSQSFFCANPLRVDIYSGCAHACEYCFAGVRHRPRDKREGGKDQFFKGITVAPSAGLSSFFERAQKGKPEFWRLHVQARRPLHIGGMSDPFQPVEREQRASELFLRVLIAHDRYPAIWSTKGSLVGEYASLLKEAGSVVQISCIATKSLPIIEPGAPPFADRLRAAELLIRAGVPVILRCQPIITELLSETKEVVEAFAKLGAHAMVAEGLKKSGHLKSMPGMDQICGEDFLARFVKNGTHDGSEYSYTMRSKIRYILALREIARAHKMEFYVGDNNLRQLGDGPNCCGSGTIPGYDNFHRAQVSPLLFQGRFSFDDVGRDSILSATGLDGMNAPHVNRWHDKASFNELLRAFFNSGKGACIMRTCGGVEAVGLTEQKNVVYQVLPESELLARYGF